MLLRLLAITVTVTFNFTALSSNVPPNPDSSIQAFESFKQALSARLNLPQQDKSLPTTTIPSTDCHIQIKDVSQYGDRLMIEISRNGGVWILSIGKMEPAEFQAYDDGFSFRTYSQDCEEMGCEGDWYVHRALFIGSNFLKAHSTEPYSRKSGTFTCQLD